MPPIHDPDCSTYWCPQCSRELTINYRESSADAITLWCRHCGYAFVFMASEEPVVNTPNTVEEPANV